LEVQAVASSGVNNKTSAKMLIDIKVVSANDSRAVFIPDQAPALTGYEEDIKISINGTSSSLEHRLIVGTISDVNNDFKTI
jgi:hypothetical protein